MYIQTLVLEVMISFLCMCDNFKSYTIQNMNNSVFTSITSLYSGKELARGKCFIEYHLHLEVNTVFILNKK